MSYYKDSDERDHMDKNEEKMVTNDIEVLKMGKLSWQQNMDNIEKQSDERNWMDMMDDK